MTENPNKVSYEEAYNKLNSAQKEAVDAIEGPVMVIAGPGTGKTQILTLRIANILKQTDTKPENILALTFTESGARNLKERLRGFVGSAAYRVNAFTFHGFADKLIHQYPEAYNQIVGSRPARELEKVAIIENILTNPDFKILRPLGDPTLYVKSIISQISELKREYITQNDLSFIINKQELELEKTPKIHEKGAHKGKIKVDWLKQEKSINKNKELLLVYRQYEASLRAQKLYDFDDMIVETIKALETNADMLLDLQETYQYLLADEHQDVNGSQNKILALLASYHESPNLFVVGDEKQAIFRFQGASLENFLYFESVYPTAKIITLTENYRSGQPILDLAHSLVSVEDGPLKDLRVPLHAQTSEATIELAQFDNQVVESTWVVDQVSNILASGVKPEEVAIILRTNKEVEFYAEALRKKGITAMASADSDILEHPLTQAIVDLLTATTQPNDEATLFTLLQQPYWNIPITDIFTICSARSYDTPLCSILFDKSKLDALKLTDRQAVEKIKVVLESARSAALIQSPTRVLEKLINESGLLAFVTQFALPESIRIIRRLYDEVEAMVVQNNQLTLNTVVGEIKALIFHKVALSAPYLVTDKKAVLVMTAHKAKGLEFSHTFIPALVDGKWGGMKSRNTFKIPLTKHLTDDLVDDSDDDRRLLYVALTRAKTGLHLSLAINNNEGKEKLPSRFLEQLDLSQVINIDTKVHEMQFDLSLSLQSSPNKSQIPLEFLSEVLKERGFSATSLNNYLSSPWDFIFRNVLRIPEIQPLHLQYGNALHGVLEKATKMHTNSGSLPNPTLLRELLTSALSHMPINDHEFTRVHQQGLEELLVYFETLKNTLPQKTAEEFKIKVLFQTGVPELPEIPLTGKFDRLDFNDAGDLIRVVDYKTGAPKTRNAIEGKTKDADGNYKRQLVFYALLLSLYDDPRYQTRECLLTFIRPDEKGKIHEELFSISDSEIDSLKNDIKTAVMEIVSGSFLDKKDNLIDSDYYQLANSLFSRNQD
jgi:DNA helicase II / ATP-dependent DNA helicase PcrA